RCDRLVERRVGDPAEAQLELLGRLALVPQLCLEPHDLGSRTRAYDEPRAEGAERDSEDEGCQDHEPKNGRDRAGRSPGPQKISSDKSEDPPELSAGSSESEDLPDPTGGKLSRGWARGQSHLQAKRPQIATISKPLRNSPGEQPFASVRFHRRAPRIRRER